MHQETESIPDQELIDGFLRHRSEREFRQLYQRHAAGIHRLALHLANYDRVIADEAAQEAWITAMKKLETYRGASSFKTWLTGILIYKVKELQRAVRRTPGETLNTELGEATSGYPGIGVDLQRSLARLSEGYHQVLVLHDAEGYTHQEIAELLGISEGTSKSQLFHARKQVRQFFNT
jgi:RNA polymerase sigma-70 factor, ECF subfamily